MFLIQPHVHIGKMNKRDNFYFFWWGCDLSVGFFGLGVVACQGKCICFFYEGSVHDLFGLVSFSDKIYFSIVDLKAIFIVPVDL